jgi:electron transport complex protein RnfB
VTDRATLADAIDAALPQTQCTRCGYPDCRAYAEAIAAGEAGINQCPPGGQEGIERLARITGAVSIALDPARGDEGPLRLARIDEAACIGCTLCIDACPVDCIVGAAKLMHTVIESQCTGCELCIPACPVDCIELVEATPGRSGWDAWSADQADAARERYAFRRERLERERREREAGDPKRAALAAAMARVRARRKAPEDVR